MSSTCHFDRIPPEPLSGIFIFSLPASGFASARTDSAPININGVCKPWCQLSISSPRLWSSIRRGYSDGDPYFAANLETWISRSGCCGLSFCIEKSFYRYGKGETEFEAALDVLVRSERWVVGDVTVDNRAALELASVIPHRTPSLKRVGIVDSDEDPTLWVLDLFKSSTPLHQLTDVPPTWCVSFRAGRPLPNIRNICLNAVECLDMVDCLLLCPCLEELAILAVIATLDCYGDNEYDASVVQPFKIFVPPSSNRISTTGQTY
ncbi:hypothetical protein BD410DRAFT_160683 [Rickenella mellea]|uniref:F-box domain-containing protein n=1 Tax=Rickenella mellea TaxID=50990 RepID=A0A4Y7Q7Z4_9AGAM|nr:hypothetical protein BD410DRAFT_160683 [Rickenella mellea]